MNCSTPSPALYIPAPPEQDRQPVYGYIPQQADQERRVPASSSAPLDLPMPVSGTPAPHAPAPALVPHSLTLQDLDREYPFPFYSPYSTPFFPWLPATFQAPVPSPDNPVALPADSEHPQEPCGLPPLEAGSPGCEDESRASGRKRAVLRRGVRITPAPRVASKTKVASGVKKNVKFVVGADREVKVKKTRCLQACIPCRVTGKLCSKEMPRECPACKIRGTICDYDAPRDFRRNKQKKAAGESAKEKRVQGGLRALITELRAEFPDREKYKIRIARDRDRVWIATKEELDAYHEFQASLGPLVPSQSPSPENDCGSVPVSSSSSSIRLINAIAGPFNSSPGHFPSSSGSGFINTIAGTSNSSPDGPSSSGPSPAFVIDPFLQGPGGQAQPQMPTLPVDGPPIVPGNEYGVFHQGGDYPPLQLQQLQQQQLAYNLLLSQGGGFYPAPASQELGGMAYSYEAPQPHGEWAGVASG